MKQFLSYELVRNNSLKLAQRMYREDFIPDVIYASLRGGAYMANVISEYFKVCRKGLRPVFYAALVAHSYTGVATRSEVRIDGWTYSPEYLRTGDKVLLVDDIFDSGQTLKHLVQILLEKGIPRSDIRIAVHDYKFKSFVQDPQLPVPDYFARKHVIDHPQDDIWIHYLSHELIGLSPTEINEQYGSDPEVVRLLLDLCGDNDRI